MCKQFPIQMHKLHSFEDFTTVLNDLHLRYISTIIKWLDFLLIIFLVVFLAFILNLVEEKRSVDAFVLLRLLLCLFVWFDCKLVYVLTMRKEKKFHNNSHFLFSIN